MPLPTPTRAEVADIARRTADRIEKILRAHGRSLDPEQGDAEPVKLQLEHPVLAACYDAAARGIAVSASRHRGSCSTSAVLPSLADSSSPLTQRSTPLRPGFLSSIVLVAAGGQGAVADGGAQAQSGGGTGAETTGGSSAQGGSTGGSSASGGAGTGTGGLDTSGGPGSGGSTPTPTPAFCEDSFAEDAACPAAAGDTYYVSSSSGDAENDGLTEDAPLATIGAVNSLALAPGDRVLFRCGDTWDVEQLNITASGEECQHIVYGSYPAPCADGEAPTLSGRRAITGWTEQSSNVWVAELGAGDNLGRFPRGINQVFQGESRLPMRIGRQPETHVHHVVVGNLRIEGYFGSGISYPVNLQNDENYDLILRCNAVQNVEARGLNLQTWVWDHPELSEWYGGRNLVVQGNVIEGANHFGIQSYARASVFEDNVVADVGLLASLGRRGLGCEYEGDNCTEDGAGIHLPVSNASINSYDLVFQHNHVTRAAACGFGVYGHDITLQQSLTTEACSTKADCGAVREKAHSPFKRRNGQAPLAQYDTMCQHCPGVGCRLSAPSCGGQ